MDILTFTLLLGLSLGHFAFLLNHTNFVLEYSEKLNIEKVFAINQYGTWCEVNNLEHGYPAFLRETFPSFWTRLIGCPFCLVTFLSFPLAILSWTLYFPFVALAAAALASLWYLVISKFFKDL